MSRGSDLTQPGLCSTQILDWLDSDLLTIQVIQLWLNSTRYLCWLTQLRLNSNPKFANLTQIRLNSLESKWSKIWLTTNHILPNLTKSCWPGGMLSNVAVGWFFPWNATYKCKILGNVFSSEKSVTQLWLKQNPVEPTVAQMMISVILVWLHSSPWFSRSTQLWIGSFKSESSQVWLTTHESSTSLDSTLSWMSRVWMIWMSWVGVESG